MAGLPRFAADRDEWMPARSVDLVAQEVTFGGKGTGGGHQPEARETQPPLTGEAGYENLRQIATAYDVTIARLHCTEKFTCTVRPKNQGMRWADWLVEDVTSDRPAGWMMFDRIDRLTARRLPGTPQRVDCT